MKKGLISLLTGLVILGFANNANAAIISLPAIQDATIASSTVQFYQVVQDVPQVVNVAAELPPTGGDWELAHGLLQFDVGSVSSILSSTLQVYGKNNTALGENVASNIYAVKFNIWNENDDSAGGALFAEKLLLSSSILNQGSYLYEAYLSAISSDYIQNGKLTLLLSPTLSVNDFGFLSKDYHTPITPAQAALFGPENTAIITQYQSMNGYYGPSLVFEVAPVPEPSSMVLGLMGLGSLLGIRRKK